MFCCNRAFTIEIIFRSDNAGQPQRASIASAHDEAEGIQTGGNLTKYLLLQLYSLASHSSDNLVPGFKPWMHTPLLEAVKNIHKGEAFPGKREKEG